MTNSQAGIEIAYMQQPYMLKLFIPLPTFDECSMLDVAS